MPAPYDAVLLVSFGGPEGMDDVDPFLDNVLRGRDVPLERRRAVVAQYESMGGVSPINGQNRRLLSALRDEFEAHGPQLPVYWGNRNWRPYLADAVRDMARDGRRRALAFVTSAYASYSGCRQYLDDIARARATVGPEAPGVDKLRLYYNHPGFVAACRDRLRAAFEALPGERRPQARLVFTAHSLPTFMAATCDYEVQLRETAGLVAEGVGSPPWSLAWQSRSGPPSQPWLEPDISDHLRSLAAEGAQDVVVAPIGFVSDHMEVVYDLDRVARGTAEGLGLRMERAQTVGTHPAFVRMVRDLVDERASDRKERPALGTRGPGPDACDPACCPPPPPRKPS
jgi:ferrochelatase